MTCEGCQRVSRLGGMIRKANAWTLERYRKANQWHDIFVRCGCRQVVSPTPKGAILAVRRGEERWLRTWLREGNLRVRAERVGRLRMEAADVEDKHPKCRACGALFGDSHMFSDWGEGKCEWCTRGRAEWLDGQEGIIVGEVIKQGKTDFEWLAGPCGRYWMHLGGLEPSHVWELAGGEGYYPDLEECPQCKVTAPELVKEVAL